MKIHSEGRWALFKVETTSTSEVEVVLLRVSLAGVEVAARSGGLDNAGVLLEVKLLLKAEVSIRRESCWE